MQALATTRTNLVTNPSFETNTNGWGGVGGGVTASITRQSGIGQAGVTGNGSALSFDGAGTQYGSAVDSTSLRLTTAASFVFWIKTTSTTGRDLIVKTGASNGFYLVRYESNGQIRLQFYDGTTSMSGYTHAPVGDGSWHHVVITWSGSGTNIAMYIDGATTAIDYATLATISPTYNTNPTYLGLGALSGGSFQGSLSHVQIYNRQLSASEVTSSFLGAVPGGGLVAEWPLDQTSGTAVSDNSGTGNNLALTGAPTWIAGGPLPSLSSARLVSNGGGALVATSGLGTGGTPCIVGLSYTASGYIRNVGVAHTGYMIMNFYDSSGTNIQGGYNTYTLSTTAWTRVSYTAVAPASAAFVGFYLQTDVTSVETAYIDAVLLEVGAAPTAYFDGAQGTGYSWTGTPNASTSIYKQWPVAVASASRNVNFGVQMSFPQTLVTSGFFTIGTSTIGGPDIIKSGGAVPAFFDKYQYTDYSQYLISMSVSQKIGQYPYGIIMSQASLQLDNGNYLFTPGKDATIGAYILPNRPMKLSLGFNNETLQQFTGFTDQPAHDRSDLSFTLTAVDVFNYIANYVSQTTTTLVGQRADQIIAVGLAEMGFSASQYALDTSLQVPIGAISPFGQRWGTIFQSLCEAEQALMFADENGIIRWWNRQHMIISPSTVWSLDYTNLENLQSQSTPIFNDVIVVANPRAVAANQKVWELGSALTLPAGSYSYAVDFSDNDGALPVTAVNTPVAYTSATTSSFTANAAPDGSGIDKTGSLSITSVTLQGTSAVVVFSNSSSGTIYLTKMSLFGTPAKVTQHISIRYTDATSVAQYGINPGNNGYPLEIDNDLIQDISTANGLAYGIVYNYKDGRQMYTVLVAANPAIQIGDQISVYNQDSGLTKTMYVTGRTMTLAVGELSHTLNLEERIGATGFKIGISTIGGTDALAV